MVFWPSRALFWPSLTTFVPCLLSNREFWSMIISHAPLHKILTLSRTWSFDSLTQRISSISQGILTIWQGIVTIHFKGCSIWSSHIEFQPSRTEIETPFQGFFDHLAWNWDQLSRIYVQLARDCDYGFILPFSTIFWPTAFWRSRTALWLSRTECWRNYAFCFDHVS